MTQTNQDLSHLIKNYDGTYDTHYPLGNKPNGGGGETTQYSGFNLSGGTIVCGPYCAEDEFTAPADSKWFAFNGTSNFYSYANGGFEVNYIAGDDSNVGASLRIGQQGAYSEVYLEFDVEFDNSEGLNNGNKFIKIKGENVIGYANFTFGIEYGGGTDTGDMLELSYGDGATTTNDTTRTISYNDALEPSINGRNEGLIQKSTPHGFWLKTEWNPTPENGLTRHHVKIAFRYNSGDTAENELPDGGFFMQIDDQVIVDAGNLYNSHYQNTKAVNAIAIGDIAQNHGNFKVRYYNITALTGGFL